MVRIQRYLNIGLVPGEAEAAGKGWVLDAVSEKWTVLDGEEVKRQTRLDSLQVEDQCVVELAADYSGPRTRLFIVVRAQAVDGGGIGNEIKADHIPLLLGLGHAGECEHAEQASGNRGCRPTETGSFNDVDEHYKTPWVGSVRGVRACRSSVFVPPRRRPQREHMMTRDPTGVLSGG